MLRSTRDFALLIGIDLSASREQVDPVFRNEKAPNFEKRNRPEPPIVKPTSQSMTEELIWFGEYLLMNSYSQCIKARVMQLAYVNGQSIGKHLDDAWHFIQRDEWLDRVCDGKSLEPAQPTPRNTTAYNM